MGDSLFSINHEVTSIVLKHPLDKISNVKYLEFDVCSGSLPLPSDYFDIFISPATLHLIGLNRYGDKFNPYCLYNLLSELDRVLKRGAHLFVCIPLGPNSIIVNMHWIFEFETILEIFHPFSLVEYFVDEWAGIPGCISPTDASKLNLSVDVSGVERIISSNNRFTQNTNIKNLKIGEYKIIYLHFKKE